TSPPRVMTAAALSCPVWSISTEISGSLAETEHSKLAARHSASKQAVRRLPMHIPSIQVFQHLRQGLRRQLQFPDDSDDLHVLQLDDFLVHLLEPSLDGLEFSLELLPFLPQLL